MTALDKWKNPKRIALPKKLKDRVKAKFNGRCGYCGEICEKLQIDHVIPLMAYHGTNDESNLMPACFQCNSFKTAMNLEAFRREIAEQLQRASRYSVNYRVAKKYMQLIETPSPIIFYFERVKNG